MYNKLIKIELKGDKYHSYFRDKINPEQLVSYYEEGWRVRTIFKDPKTAWAILLLERG